MNYEEHYNRLIQKAKNREIIGYTESHHIIPKCLGGDNSKTNLVKLTGREHFIAHLLLSKIHNKSYGLIKAIAMMCCSSSNQNRSMNRMYGWMKEKYSKSMSISQSGELNSQYGTKWINNPLTRENKKLPKNGILPIGWEYGKFKIKKESEPSRLKEIKLKQDKELYNYYYSVYKEVGFNEFVKITNYKFSKQNLVQRFSVLVEDFKPQNGKKRSILI